MQGGALLSFRPVDPTVDVWIWALDVPQEERAYFEALLSEDERARRSRFIFTRDADRYASARGRMREILGGYLEEDPAALRFSYNQYGKPSLGPSSGNTGFRFNLSHSNGLAALAVSTDLDVGIDIEAIRPVDDNLAQNSFSQQECRSLSALAPSDHLVGFYRCWTRKEAFIKAMGHGLSIPLDSFAVEVAPNNPARLLWWHADPLASDRWGFYDFQPQVGWAGAIALASQRAHIQMMPLKSPARLTD